MLVFKQNLEREREREREGRGNGITMYVATIGVVSENVVSIITLCFAFVHIQVYQKIKKTKCTNIFPKGICYNVKKHCE